MKKTLLLLSVISLLIVGCTTSKETTTTGKIPATEESPTQETEKVVYKADKDMCGEIVLTKNLAEGFDSALKVLEEEKKDEYSKYCPNNPCYEIDLKSKKAQELKDFNGNAVNKDLFFIEVLDKSTGLKVHSLSEAIDEEGNLYNLNWCAD